MKFWLARILQVQPGELARVLLLLLMGFSMGMFLATVTVASSSLFLAHFVEEESLPKAFLLSGVFGLAVTFVYNVFQNRIPFSILAALSLVLVAGLTAMLEFGQDFFSDINDLYFLGFTLIIPFTFLVNLVFWGTFGRLFNTRQAKRLLGTVDAGAMIASFIAYFSIPQILKIVESDKHLYGISLFSITLFVLLFLYLSTGYLNKLRSFKEEKSFYRKTSLATFFKSRYLLDMSAFVIVSMLVLNFIDYSFLNVTTMMLDEANYAAFISYFEMTIVIFNFLFQTFATDRIVKDYGLGAALLINPFLIGSFALLAIVSGKYLGYDPSQNYFVVFFICVAMSKLFMSSLRDALDNQTLRLYFLPLEQSVRIDIQTKIEGMVTALATLLAGALIILINTVKVFDFFSVIVAIVPLAAVWFYIARRLHAGYQATLQNTLSQRRPVTADSTAQNAYSASDVLRLGITDPMPALKKYALKLTEKLEPSLYEDAVAGLNGGIQGSQNKVQRTTTHEIRYRPGHVEDLSSLCHSTDPDDRERAAQLLIHHNDDEAVTWLLELLRDPAPAVRRSALQAARKVPRPETWSVLIEMLSTPTYSNLAAAALIEAGESVLPVLEQAFHKTGQLDIRMLRIVQIMGKIGGKYATKLLWRKTDYPDKRIVHQILLALRRLNVHATGKEVRDVVNLLETEIGKALWNEAALHELPDQEIFQYLREALAEELRENHQRLGLLLSLLYDPQAVDLVQKNLASGDPDNIAFALELLDQFIDPSLKPRLIPLLDDSSIDAKMHQLQLLYPRERYTPIQLINYLLNRDINLTNRWTKACAIHATAFLDAFNVSKGLTAQVFNPDKLLQETAAWVIWHKDRAAYDMIATRLPADEARSLELSIANNRLLDGLNDGFFLRIEMIMQLMQVSGFRHLQGACLAELAEKVVPIDMAAGKKISLALEKTERPLLFVAHGCIRFYTDDGDRFELAKGEALGDLLQESDVPLVDHVEALERSVLFKIQAQDFVQVLNDHHNMIEALIRRVREPDKEQAVSIEETINE